MSDANGIATREPDPVALVLLGGFILVGAVRDLPDGRVEIADPCEYRGQIAIGAPNEAGESPVQGRKAVLPFAGLASLRSLPVHPVAVKLLSEFAPEEAREILYQYHACLELLGGLRAQIAGIVKPKGPSMIVIPGGRS